ncbi:MAG: arylesterase [Pseudomonadota bacterium]|nr:arylesterase [Pseudomonadota bacterium]
MKFIVFILTVLLSLRAWADYTLAVFGDSLSAGYHLNAEDSFYAQLERALQNKGYKVSVLNISKSGEVTAGGVRRTPTVLNKKPDGVILELGINDAFRKIPVSSIQKNLQHMIDLFQQNKIAVLLVGMKAPLYLQADYQQAFEKMYSDLASQNGILLYPFFMDGIFDEVHILNARHQNEYLLLNDFHPNARGINVMVQGILPTVEQFLNKQGVFVNGY